jgi:hypothetical protein
MNHGEIVSFVWGIADLIRDTFRRGHYQDVILPLTRDRAGLAACWGEADALAQVQDRRC